MMSQVGKSIMLSALSEVFAFSLAAFTGMPAVQGFAIFASVAVLFNFILQITCFVAFITLDARREENGRYDVCTCKQYAGPLPAVYASSDDETSSTSSSEHETLGHVNLTKSSKPQLSPTVLREYLMRVHVPFVLHPVSKIAILFLFLLVFFVSTGRLVYSVQLGLDQSTALPRSSHVVQYLKDFQSYTRVGPPLYFVVPDGVDWADPEFQNRICTIFGCDDDSLGMIITRAARFPEITSVSQPASSWLDDYLIWIDPHLAPFGCRTRIGNPDQFCHPDDFFLLCTACISDKNDPKQWNAEYNRPSRESFYKYLAPFRDSECTETSGVCGSGHADNVEWKEDGGVGAARFYELS
eukprot:GABV01000131.1.p1 GENE.GABV01000131.1~~GABV01000131.1.p1  ORF type:complete len:354 (-),score=111.79 GABV01000131.1:73-1134(-)